MAAPVVSRRIMARRSSTGWPPCHTREKVLWKDNTLWSLVRVCAATAWWKAMSTCWGHPKETPCPFHHVRKSVPIFSLCLEFYFSHYSSCFILCHLSLYNLVWLALLLFYSSGTNAEFCFFKEILCLTLPFFGAACLYSCVVISVYKAKLANYAVLKILLRGYIY